MKMRFGEFMRAAHVQRWHIVNTVKQQNIAEHSYLVALIAMELYAAIVGFDDPGEVNKLIIGALFHDSAEIRYGDIPTPGKNYIRSRTSDDLFDKLDAELVPTLPYINEVVPQRMAPFIAMADMIEAAWWIRNNGAGDFAHSVADKCWLRLQTELEAVADDHRDEWYQAVNSVLTALGMPVINQEQVAAPL